MSCVRCKKLLTGRVYFYLRKRIVLKKKNHLYLGHAKFDFIYIYVYIERGRERKRDFPFEIEVLSVRNITFK